MNLIASAVAHPNIAFIKYWGNQDHALRIPRNGSLSMNLRELQTRTQVHFNPALKRDKLVLNGKEVEDAALIRVSDLLDRVRDMADIKDFASVESSNSFPSGAGIASSASAFAALSVAASKAAGLSLSEIEQSRLARTGSGSACRSIPGGFVEWNAGVDHESSYAQSIAEPDHWDLVDLIAIISGEHKDTGSTQGHRLADTSPLQEGRVKDADRRLEICRTALLNRDFPRFAEIVEQDSNLMHAVMMTSTPPLYYWLPGTVEVISAIQDWRKSGLAVCSTIDAGPNVHVICPATEANNVKHELEDLSCVNSILECHPGGPAYLLE